MTRAAALTMALALGCARALPAPRTPTSVGVTGALADALPGLLGAEGRERAVGWGIALHPSQGATAITGERATDDVVARAEAALAWQDAAVVLAQTACGNVVAVGLSRASGRWLPRGALALVGNARPGRCLSTTARSSAQAILSDAPRELVVELRSVSDEGDLERGPELRVLSLAPDGRVAELGGPIPFGHTDETTGEVERGEWAVEASLPAPRAVYVQLMPERGVGVGQALVRRTYGLRGGTFTLLEETRQRVRPTPAGP